MATLAISTEMLSGFSRLERRAREKVAELAATFQRLTAQELRASKGIHLERHEGQRDPRARTIRIDDNHRGIVIDVGDDNTFILTTIGTHDETTRWMANKTFRVNAATGALEILDVAALDEIIDEHPPVPAGGERPIYEHRRDRDFTQLGVDEALVPVLRAFTSDEQVLGLATALPPAQADAITLLTGDRTVEDIYAEVAGSVDPAAIDTDDLAAALAAPASRSSFHVVASDDELADMLARPLAQWRVYLHHTQWDAAHRNYSGPARVTGGPGTGKTVVAMHRAKALADQMPQPESRSILFTTFTRNLAEAIKDDLRLLGGSDLLDVTEVLNVDRLAHRVVSDHEGATPRVARDSDLSEIAKMVVGELGTELRPEFLVQEWEQVVLAQDIRSRDAYFVARRTGRGVRLDRRARADVWRAIEELERHLVDRGIRTHLQLAAAAAGYLESRTVRPYRHVIVDEAQDLHEAQWRLLREAVAPGANDLFIVGDSHQRIYDRRTSLTQVGIEIRGRSRRLRINYRTTHEILAWTLSLLGEGEFDDLDLGTETSDFAGYHSYLHGQQPTLSGHRSKNAQLTALTDQVATWIADGIHPEDIGVTARVGASLDSAERAMRGAGLDTARVDGDGAKRAGVRLGTMHRMKGLEFRAVAVVDADSEQLPNPWSVTSEAADPIQHRADLQRERCLLYVACTRARDDLWVGWAGKPSPFLGTAAAAE